VGHKGVKGGVNLSGWPKTVVSRRGLERMHKQYKLKLQREKSKGGKKPFRGRGPETSNGSQSTREKHVGGKERKRVKEICKKTIGGLVGTFVPYLTREEMIQRGKGTFRGRR